MQVDGAEEELPDELENACSDDGKTIKHSPLIGCHVALMTVRCRFQMTPTARPSSAPRPRPPSLCSQGEKHHSFCWTYFRKADSSPAMWSSYLLIISHHKFLVVTSRCYRDFKDIKIMSW